MGKRRYKPTLLTPVDTLPRGEEWVYQPKLDGYRMLGYVAAKQAKLITKNGNDFTDYYLSVAHELPLAFEGHDVVVDGELVALNERNQQRVTELSRRNKARGLTYYIFDLLELDGETLTQEPLMERWQRLTRKKKKIFTPQPRIKLVTMFDDLDEIWEATKQLGYEGVVAKRRNSKYLEGVRTKSWRKKKHNPSFRLNWDRR